MFFLKINKINKTPEKLKKNFFKEKAPITIIRNETRYIISDLQTSNDNKGINSTHIRTDNLDEMD